MNPNRSSIFKPAFLASLLFAAIGIFLKIMHLPGAQIVMVLCILLSIAFVIGALYEIFSSQRIKMSEKLMWTVGFVLISTVTGILYFIVGRDRILREYKILER